MSSSVEYTAAPNEDGEWRLECRYFALCDRLAEWWTEAPDGTAMPVCQRCADKVGLDPDTLHHYSVEIEGIL